MTTIRFKYLILLLLTIITTSGTSAQNGDSLSHYLKTAASNNPKVKADFMAYQASLQKIPQAKAYQDPTLDMGFFPEPMDIIGGRQVAEFRLMQMFPWFGTNKAAQTEATHMAQMAYEKFRETRDNLYLEVYTQWFILCSLQQKLLNNKENRALLAQLEQLALSRFSSPAGTGMSNTLPMSSGTMSDVLRVQLEIAEIDNNIESLLSEIKAEKAKFNALLNRNVESYVQLPEQFELIPFTFDTETAMSNIGDQNPMLGMISEEGLAYKAKAEMDKKMSYPMFGVGLQYMLNQKSNEKMFSMGDMNGKDMIMPMFSVSIPIYRGKYKSQQKENEYLLQSSKAIYADTYNTLGAELYMMQHLLDDALRKIELYNRQSALAETTYNLTVQEFTTGKSDLTNVIQVQRQFLDYKLKKAEAVASYNTMVASIQKLISFKHTEQD